MVNVFAQSGLAFGLFAALFLLLPMVSAEAKKREKGFATVGFAFLLIGYLLQLAGLYA